ncbi:MAG: response regulator, partial [Rhodospirillaceae bacterium]
MASEILSHWKVAADLANNGQEALITLSEAGEDFYDAVLMDIQMPVMDGKTATQKIRQELQMDSLPIIAMTAHAMEEERKSCLAAGMNAHVAKPIETGVLFSVLIEQWKDRPHARGGAIPSNGPGQTSSTTSGTALALPDQMPGLAIKAGLGRVMGNEKLYKKLLKDFETSLPEDAEALRQALKGQSWEDARKTAHALKGVCGNIGAQELFDRCQSIEKHLKTGKWQEAQNTLPTFDRAVGLLQTSLQDLTAALADQSPPSAAPAPAPAQASEP